MRSKALFELLVRGTELHNRLIGLIEPEVCAQHSEVHEHHSGEEPAPDDDPDDRAAGAKPVLWRCLALRRSPTPPRPPGAPVCAVAGATVVLQHAGCAR